MKQYKYKAKDYRRKVKKYWKELEDIEDKFYAHVEALKNTMKKDLGIKDVEFFWSGGDIVGIGSASKSLELIHR